MVAPKIDTTVSLDVVLDENSFTLGQLPAHPLAAPFAPQFDAFQATWTAADAARTALVIAVAKADGAVAGADAALDDFIDTFDRTLLIAVKNDRQAPLYEHFFGLKPPSVLKRPLLGDELTTVRAWIPTLQGSPVASLAALAPALTAAVAAADDAVTKQIAAQQALRDFDSVGGKATLIDAFNALRQTVYGALAALPHAMLPTTFADRFFRHNSHKGLGSMTSLTDVQTRIDGLQKDLTAAQARHKTLSDAATAKAQAKVDKAKRDAEIEQARKDRDAAEQKLRDLEKK